jgi:hypothetical protein
MPDTTLTSASGVSSGNSGVGSTSVIALTRFVGSGAFSIRLNQNRGSDLLFWRVFFTRTGIHFARKRYSKNEDRLE